MFNDLENFPFFIVNYVEFKGRNMKVMFKSGNGINATAPNDKTVDEFKQLCMKNLNEDQIIYS
jgi:protein tyrosine phosphatase